MQQASKNSCQQLGEGLGKEICRQAPKDLSEGVGVLDVDGSAKDPYNGHDGSTNHDAAVRHTTVVKGDTTKLDANSSGPNQMDRPDTNTDSCVAAKENQAGGNCHSTQLASHDNSYAESQPSVTDYYSSKKQNKGGIRGLCRRACKGTLNAVGLRTPSRCSKPQ